MVNWIGSDWKYRGKCALANPPSPPIPHPISLQNTQKSHIIIYALIKPFNGKAEIGDITRS